MFAGPLMFDAEGRLMMSQTGANCDIYGLAPSQFVPGARSPSCLRCGDISARFPSGDVEDYLRACGRPSPRAGRFQAQAYCRTGGAHRHP